MTAHPDNQRGVIKTRTGSLIEAEQLPEPQRNQTLPQDMLHRQVHAQVSAQRQNSQQLGEADAFGEDEVFGTHPSSRAPPGSAHHHTEEGIQDEAQQHRGSQDSVDHRDPALSLKTGLLSARPSGYYRSPTRPSSPRTTRSRDPGHQCRCTQRRRASRWTGPADRRASAANVYPISRKPRCRCSPVPQLPGRMRAASGPVSSSEASSRRPGSNRNMRGYVPDPRHGRRLPDSRWPREFALAVGSGQYSGSDRDLPAPGRRPTGQPAGAACSPPPPGSIVTGFPDRCR